MSEVGVRQAITQAHHEEWARGVAALTRRFGDLDIAEEAAAEMFANAVTRWPVDGVLAGNTAETAYLIRRRDELG